MFAFAYNEAVATLLGIGHVLAEDVVQSPKLLKKK
jgi:hypothetical protein